jgi:hypothetical protein
MSRDPDVLRWLAFTDRELAEIEGALGTVAVACSPDPDHPDPLDDLLGQVRAERARRAGTHSAHRTGPRTSPDPTPEPLRVGEDVLVDFAKVKAGRYGQHVRPGRLLAIIDDEDVGRMLWVGLGPHGTVAVPPEAVARERRAR